MYPIPETCFFSPCNQECSILSSLRFRSFPMGNESSRGTVRDLKSVGSTQRRKRLPNTIVLGYIRDPRRARLLYVRPFISPGRNVKILKIPFLVTITVGQSLMQFFPNFLFKDDQILENDDSFSSLNNFKRLHRFNILNLYPIFQLGLFVY